MGYVRSGSDGANSVEVGSKVCFVRSNTADGSWFEVNGYDVAGALLNSSSPTLTVDACRQSCLDTYRCSYYTYDNTTRTCKVMEQPISNSTSGITGTSTPIRTGFRTTAKTPCSYTCSKLTKRALPD